MQTNQFSGFVPETIKNASNLLILSLAENTFTGKVPKLPNVKNLQLIEIHSNDLGKADDDDLDFLYPLANNTSLSVLGIADNHFAGVLPPVLSNFSKTLLKINAGGNQIRGSIPTEIGNLAQLVALGIEANQLTGTIPTSIGKLQQLFSLFLNDNKLSGSIPSSLGNISSLAYLTLRRNNLQGSIPSRLGSCQKLFYLALAGNNLGGPIPKEILGISSLALMLDLSDNQLNGSLPFEVGKLVNLGILDVSTNKLSGEIPGILGSCSSLESLYLGENFFQGSIPQSLSELRAIKSLNVSNNKLSGQIPKYLGDLRLLNSLDLSFNEFEGEVPLLGIFANTSGVSVSGNEKLCGGIAPLGLPRCSSIKSKSFPKVKLIIAICCAVIGILLIIASVGSFYYLRKKRSQKSSRFSDNKTSMWRVSYEDISKATDGFSSSKLIGVGSFGSVYKAFFQPYDKIVAVKVLNLLQKGASKSFLAECKTLTNIRHRSLVKVLTACSSIDIQGNDFKALVYEFMANGNLDEWLYPTHISDQANESRALSLIQRLNIAIDVASALDYLHHECHAPVVHCDLKPSNVLLDSSLTAHIGDFGLARFVPKASRQSLSSAVKGTVGYAAPEYGVGSEVSTCGDIYSYGILVLEMFTAKKPTDETFKDGFNLHNYVKMAMPNRVVEIADPILLRANEESNVDSSDRTTSVAETLASVLMVGIRCSVETRKERIDIAVAVAEMNRIRSSLVGATIRGNAV